MYRWAAEGPGLAEMVSSGSSREPSRASLSIFHIGWFPPIALFSLDHVVDHPAGGGPDRPILSKLILLLELLQGLAGFQVEYAAFRNREAGHLQELLQIEDLRTLADDTGMAAVTQRGLDRRDSGPVGPRDRKLGRPIC